MRVLVTGATGFLGQHVVAELLRRGETVRALVRPGRPGRGREWLAAQGVSLGASGH